MPYPVCIISLGRKPRGIDAEVERYLRLLAPYMGVSVEYLRCPSSHKRAAGKGFTEEETRMRAHWPARSYSVVLSEDGTRMDSETFARWLGRRVESGRGIVFNIGGAQGFSDDMKRACDDVVSLSEMTFAHSIALLVLVEQVYRACTILKGHPYHKP